MTYENMRNLNRLRVESEPEREPMPLSHKVVYVGSVAMVIVVLGVVVFKKEKR